MKNKMLIKKLMVSCCLLVVSTVSFAEDLYCPATVTCQGYKGSGDCSFPAGTVGWEAQPGGIFTGDNIIQFNHLYYVTDAGICFYSIRDSRSRTGYFVVGVQAQNPVTADLDKPGQQWHDQYTRKPCRGSTDVNPSEFCTVGNKNDLTHYTVTVQPLWAPFKT